jgi:hypothetical protein
MPFDFQPKLTESTMLGLISTELAQRPTRALFHTLIGGDQPNTWLVGPVTQGHK